MSYRLLIVMFCGLLVASCATQRDGQIYQVVDHEDVHIGIIEDSLVNIEIAYVGAIGHSFIFECAIENNSNNSIVVDKNMFHMELSEDRTLSSIEDDYIVSNLRKNREELRKDKKTSTIFSGIMVGISAIAGVASGANVGEVLLFNAEPIAYIFDDRRWYDRNIKTVEDEIEYIRTAQFDSTRIYPGSNEVRDLLFPTTKIKKDVTVNCYLNEQEYYFTFPRKIFR